MGCGIEGLFLRNRVRAEHADRTGSGTVRSVVAARHGRCTEAASSSSNATFKKSSAIAEHGAAGRRARAAADCATRRSRRGRRTRQRPGGRLSRHSKCDRHQNRHANSDNTAVDLGRDQGSDRRPGRSEPRRGAALYARRLARYLRRHHALRRGQASRASTHRAISMAFGCRSIPERSSPFPASRPTVLNELKC